MKKALISLFAFLLIALFVISVSSCKKNTEPKPDDTEIEEIEDDEEEEEEEDEPDSINKAARIAAAIPAQNALIVRFNPSNPCNSGSSLRIYYRESSSISTVPITYAQRRADPVGTWRSFRFTPEKFGKTIGKAFDRSKSYALYAYDSAEKKMYPAMLISAFPSEIIVQEVPKRKAYSMAIVPISCNK